MRILVVNWQDRENPQAGGAEIHLHEVFGRLAALGHHVDLLCSGFTLPSGEPAPATTLLDGIRVFRVGARYTFPLHARKGYDALLARNRREGLPDYDVVIEDLNKIPLLTNRWPTKRLVVLTHHLFGATAFREAPFPIALLTWLAERPIGFAYRDVPFQAVSVSTADDLVARGIARDRITVIHNGVDLTNYTPDSNDRSKGPVFAYLGRLKRYKRIDLVIRAFALLDYPSARLEIAGKGDDRVRLERLVNRLQLGDRVRFLGYVDDMEKRRLLRRAWATILASPKEGWGISNLESAASGTPVIAANAPGIRESVLDGDTGFLVPGSDVSAYAAAMRGLIESPQQVEFLGRNARRFAETFTWERAAHDTLDHLQLVVGGSIAWKS